MNTDNLPHKISVRRILAADLSLLLVSLIWGAGVPMSALLARAITPLWSIALRMVVASVCLFVIFPKRFISATRLEWSLSFRQAAITAAVFVFMAFGLVYSTASKQAFIGGLNVIFVPLLWWALFKTRPSHWLFAGAAVTTVGLLVMGFTPGMRFNFGDFLSLLMALAYSAQIINASHSVQRINPFSLVVLHIVLLAAILTVLAFVFEPLPDIALFTPKVCIVLAILSLFNTIICFIIQFYAQRYTSAAHTAIICSLEGLFGYIITVASGQDPFNMQCAVGGLMTVIGTFIAEAEVFTASHGKKTS